MDPFGEIIRDCVVSSSQEEFLRRSHFHGESGESIDALATPSTSQKGDDFGGHIPQFPIGIVISSPHQRSSDEEEDGKEEEEARVREETPSRVRQVPLPESLEKFPLQKSAGKTPEKCPAGVRRMSEDKNLGVLNEDAGGEDVRPTGSKRKSTVEMELECSPGSAAKKTRYVIAESHDLSLEERKRGSSSGGSAPPRIESVNLSVELGLSKGKSCVEKDKGFFERLKARLFSRRSLGLRSPERPKGESSATLRITAGVNTENVKRSPVSEEKISPAVKDERFSRSKGFSPGKSAVSELWQGIGNVRDANAPVSKEKDRGLLKLKEESSRKSLASELPERINNVTGADADVSEGNSPEQGCVGFSKLKVNYSRMPSASELPESISNFRDADTIVSKGRSPAKEDSLLLKLKGDSSVQFSAKDSETLQKSAAATTPKVLPGDGKSPSPKKNQIAEEGKPRGTDDNIGSSKSPGRIQSKFLAEVWHSKSAGGTPNASNDPPAQQSNKEEGLDNPPSDVHHDAGRNPSSNDTGLPVDRLLNVRYNQSSDAPECSSKQFITEALGISKSNSEDVWMQRKRKLPSSIQCPSDENKGHSVRGGEPISKAKSFDNARVMHLLDMAKALCKESEHVIEQESILEVAKRAGYLFPRPRWWHPDG